MNSSVPSTNNNNTFKSTSPTSNSSANSSDFSKEQWLQLLRILPPNSLRNLQSAWKEFVEETGGQRNPDQKTLLPDASTLVRIAASQQFELTPSTYEKLLKQQLDLDRKPLEGPNGLDALAAAALGNTNTETNVTSTPAVTVLQGKPMPIQGLVAIPFSPQITPTLFKSDSNQRQSPTIHETPKRLAVTRAEAEQAAQGQGNSSNESVKRNRLSADASVEDMDTSNTLSHISTGGNLLLSNGVLSTVASLKQDPESVNHGYSFHTNAQDMCSNWNAPASTSSGVTTAECNRRRARDEGITDDEAARREKRRERNRVAAAKCRQNRQNQIEELKSRKKRLEDDGEQIKQRLDNLKREKQQLEELIKNHARKGCPSASTYYQDGKIILPFSATTVGISSVNNNTVSTTNRPQALTSVEHPKIAAIIQSSTAHQLSPSNSSTIAVIKSEAPSSSDQQFMFSPQRPNTLPLVNSTKMENTTPTLDSASTTANQLTQMWTPSIISKIKTPGGESWVNSQIGLPALSSEKEGGVSTPTAFRSAPELFQYIGGTLGTASISNSNEKSQEEKMPNASINTSSAT